MTNIIPVFYVNLSSGAVAGVHRWERRLSDMREDFASVKDVEAILEREDPLIYEVYEINKIVTKIGELIWSTTILYPGKVGNEYYMTKGHYHQDLNCSEVYLVFSGQGFLLIKQGQETHALPLKKGALAHLPPGCAHRVVNTGKTPLVFFAVYPAQAGHDYERVRQEGFGLRIVDEDGRPALRRLNC